MQRIIVLTTDGDSREDGNVYYSDYVILESNTLNFDESFFETKMTIEDFLNTASAAGYAVIEAPIMIIEVESG